ncbi:chain-length determining protein [Phocaeicola coprocola]|uniref:Chain-length determining protein n=1 Tax=Phocaeicola coprocola TaxID=310298 RepID=A0A412GZ53_9BACT|nr:chain-length determining protein [Phocaeicola coprocola]RGS00235.1 chain-length determining protein [Phocaeicola coprocola]
MNENKNYQHPDVQDPENDELEIDWMEILRKIIAIRKTLYKAAGVGVVLGIIIALSIPKQYTVTVTLSPEMGGDKAGGGLASLASSFLGGGANSSPDALNATLAPDIVASTPFILELFNTKVQTLDGKLDTTLVAYLDEQQSPWFSYIVKAPSMAIGAIKSLFSEEADTVSALNPFQLTEKEASKVEAIKQSIIAEVDKKTAKTTISVTLQDPKVTAIVADSVVAKLQQYIIDYRIKKAKEDCAYLEQLYKERQQEYYEAQSKYAHYFDSNRNIAFQSVRAEQERLQNDMNLAYQVYSQVAQQLQVARAKIQEEKPVFAVVEPATVPLLPSSTSKKVIVLGFIILTVCATGVWTLIGKDYINNLCQSIQGKN